MLSGQVVRADGAAAAIGVQLRHDLLLLYLLRPPELCLKGRGGQHCMMRLSQGTMMAPCGGLQRHDDLLEQITWLRIK